MRVVRLLVCLLALAAALVAQTSSGNVPGTAEAGAGARPQSPLEEPAKPTEAEQNKPKQSTFDVGEAQTASQDQFLGEIRLMTRYTELGGDTSRSFRVPDGNNLAEINLFSDRAFLGTRRIQFLSMYRGTDDRSIDPEHNSLQKAYVRIFGPREEYIFGDSLVNYSRLTFNQNIKGVNLTHAVGERWKVGGTGGIFVDRWGSLYKEMNGSPFTSTVFGGRVEYAPLKDSSIGLNFSSFNDQVSSLPLTLPNGSPQPSIPANNQVASLDSKWMLRNFRMESELAYSFTDYDKRDAAGCPLVQNGVIVDPTRQQAHCDSRVLNPGLGTQGDWGGRMEASLRLRRVSLRTSYLRFQPAFASLNARQIEDLQDFVGRASVDVTDWLTVDGTMRRSNNNLKGQLGETNVLWGPEARLIFHDMPFYRRAVIETGYRHRLGESSNKIKLDRTVRIPFVEFTIPVQSTFFNIGYEQRRVEDRINIGATSNTNRVYVGLRGMWDFGGWRVNPSIRMELERLGHRPGLDNSVPDLELIYDSNRLSSAQLYVETPKWFILEGAFRSASATLTSRNLVGLPPAYISAANGYSRPAYRGALTYKINNDENTLFIFSFERNNNFYLSSKDYDERVWAGTLVYRFGRRAQ